MLPYPLGGTNAEEVRMKLFKVLPVCVVAVALLGSCASQLQSIRIDQISDNSASYVVLKFNDPGGTGGLRFNAPGGSVDLFLTNLETKGNIVLSVRSSDENQAFQIDAGHYRIWEVSQSYVNGSQYRTVTLELPEILKSDFTVDKGTIVYIGKLSVKNETLKRVVTFEDDFAAAKAAIAGGNSSLGKYNIVRMN